MSYKYIHIRGARQHNLKNIDIDIPKNKFVVITGLSGSGKSSLAFDTIYAEGQRRYVESLSTYARQFLELMEKPDVDSIEGLSPSISIEQKTVSKNPRSTVATVTEIYDYLRILYANLGEVYCYKCGKKITSQTPQQIADEIVKLPEKTKLILYAPVVRQKKGEFRNLFTDLLKNGFTRVRVDGVNYFLEDEISLDKNKKHEIDVIIDRIVLKKGIENRLIDSIETGLNLANGLIKVEILDEKREIIFSERFACVQCGISYPEISPRFFSFNNPYGACPRCKGLGYISEIDEYSAFNSSYDLYYLQEVYERVKNFEVSPEKRFRLKNMLNKYLVEKECELCKGARLNKEALAVKFKGANIYEFTLMTVKDALKFIENLNLNDFEKQVGEKILKEIKNRLYFLNEVGLGYIILNRRSSTLSGGESQRIRLAAQIGSALTGVIYVLDEPSIGLHPRDTKRLITTLKKLRDSGNTVIVVEHDEDIIKSSDFVIDLGPEPGRRGGYVVAATTPEKLKKVKNSYTGKFLSGKLKTEKFERKKNFENFIEIYGAKAFNLKNIDVKIPTSSFVCITGVSGSGKSTLLNEVIYKGLRKILNREMINTENLFDKIETHGLINKVILIDQSPIGRTSRSNPATYTGVFNSIRELFSQIPQAKMRGYKPGRFSFNVKGGRCEKCKGEGVIKLEMLFMPEVYIKCEECNGKRFNRDTLQIRYKDKNIADVLEMTVNEAYDFFKNIPHIKRKLEVLKEVGLGYLQLGQPAPTLSGGEAQRIKLTKELSKRDTGKTVYLLDEPTTGLHYYDINNLLKILFKLRDKGNTIIVIEHNLEVIKSADYIIDLGPEGGDGGGHIVAQGPPSVIVKSKKSYTGKYLKL